jgi:23S rRNA (uridine2552-2'-O)-methyltransferase
MKVQKQSGKKGKKLNKAWLNDHLNDPYVKMATRDGYRARAAYKLKEMDETLGLIKPGMTVVDLGSAPGAWSQYLRRKLGGTEGANMTGSNRVIAPNAKTGVASGEIAGRIVALDILPMLPVEDVTFILGDFREEVVLAKLHETLGGAASFSKVDCVVSDMAPNLSGVESADAARMCHLVEIAVEFAKSHLTPEGALVVKVFHGSGYSQLVKLFKETFEIVKPMKPKASRDKSAENFIVGIRLKPLL